MKVTGTIGEVLQAKKVSSTFTISPQQTVYEALLRMAEHEIGALPVLDSEGRLAGIFSERDYARKGILLGHAAKETLVSEVMTAVVVSVSPQESVDTCMSMMTERRIRHLPVLDGGRLAGLISIGDLVKWVIGGQEKAILELEGYICGNYPS